MQWAFGRSAGTLLIWLSCKSRPMLKCMAGIGLQRGILQEQFIEWLLI